MSDTARIYQEWPREVLEEFDKLWRKRYTSRTAATVAAVSKLIEELKEA